MTNQNNRRYLHRHISDYKLLSDNKRQIPCHPSIKIRVKIIEPGIQSRWCDRCQDYRYFTLELHPKFGALKLRWLTDMEVQEHLRTNVNVPIPEWVSGPCRPQTPGSV